MAKSLILAALVGVTAALTLGGCSDAAGTNGGTGTTAAGSGGGTTAGGENPEGTVGTGNDGPFAISEQPRLEFDPAQDLYFIVEALLEPGDTQTFTIGVFNSGQGLLRITDVELVYETPVGGDDGEHSAFELLNPPTAEIEVFTQGSDSFPQRSEFRVAYTLKEDGLSRSAQLNVYSNDPNTPVGVIAFSTEAGVPDLQTDRDRIDFPRIPANQVGEEPLLLLNAGTQTLMVSGFKITQDGRFGVKDDTFEIGGSPDSQLAIDLPEAIPIAPGSSYMLTTTFFSDSDTPAEGQLLIYSDDPTSGQVGHAVELTANKSGPCITVSPDDLVSFGGVKVGESGTTTVTITSCGTEALALEGISITDASSPDFSVDVSALVEANDGLPLSDNTPFLLDVNSSVEVPVTFTPDEVNPKDPDKLPIPDEGTLRIVSNAFNTNTDIALEGAGGEDDCPVAKIVIEEGEEVIPQTVLHLDATQSYAAFGAIQSYLWTVDQPAGSQEVLVPSATDPTPIFQANVVGLYTFTLRVRDQDGNWECKPDVYNVLVQPDQAIHVELTWDTPLDEDQTDSGPFAGTDLDLHFAHPNASGPDLDGNGVPDPWFDKEWDSFWYVPNPNWGSFDPLADDDPSLDRDDTDGAGPENLNIGIPEENIAYHIGVHYWDDRDLGETTAMVKVYTYATLIYEGCAGGTEETCCTASEEEGNAICEVIETPLKERDMWCVGAVNWPEPQVGTCEPVAPDTIVPAYTNPFFLNF